MNKKACLFGLSVFVSQATGALTLDKAAVCDGSPATKSVVELNAGKVIGAVYKSAGVNAGLCIGWTNLGSGDVWYEVTRRFTIHSIDVRSREYLGGWSLGRTKDDSKEEIKAMSAVNAPDYTEHEYRFQIGTNNDAALGCLWDHPLRYGDIEQDGETELVLLLGRDELDKVDRKLDFAIFSPQKNAVTFSARLAREDIGSSPDGVVQGPDIGRYPQMSSMVEGRTMLAPATRAYAKLFFGHFDGDDKPDILVWRKRFQPRRMDDPVKGFALDKQLLTHYEFENGGYSEQSTEESVIDGWLGEKQLTWKSGYPSTSECEGQSGQLIPEFHEPLLNDPQVLP